MPKSKSADELELERVQARFDKIKAEWPYDETQDMTPEQLKEQGAEDVTEQHNGLGILISKGS